MPSSVAQEGFGSIDLTISRHKLYDVCVMCDVFAVIGDCPGYQSVPVPLACWPAVYINPCTIFCRDSVWFRSVISVSQSFLCQCCIHCVIQSVSQSGSTRQACYIW